MISESKFLSVKTHLYKIIISTVAFTMFIILLIMNQRFPFFLEQSDGWSVGFNVQKDVLSGIHINPDNILLAGHTDLSTSYNSKFIADPFFLKEIRLGLF